MKKVLAVVAIAVLTCSVAAAKVNPVNPGVANKTVTTTFDRDSRASGALGSLTVTTTQTGALQVQLDASCTTVGGSGVSWTGQLTGGTIVTLHDQVGLYVQIYDSPWAGGCQSWATPGPNWCSSNWELFTNAPTALGSFATSFTTTVPQPDDYQTFFLAAAGTDWFSPAYDWYDTTQALYVGPVNTLYVDSSVPPTATPDPTAGGIPVPTMNQWGIAAMVILLIGVAMLIITRRQ